MLFVFSEKIFKKNLVMEKNIFFEFRCADLGYGNRKVISTIDFTIGADSITCVLGPNGVGKTTLFRSMLGFIPPLSGEILLNGKKLSNYPAKVFAKMVAYVAQNHTAPFPYKVKEIVLFGRAAHLGLFSSPGKADQVIADRYIDWLGITHLANRNFAELSGGERQLVLVARALAQEARFIIFDEPTSNLDYGNQLNVIQTLKSLNKSSIKILVATHSPDHAFMLGASVIFLNKGKAIYSGKPENAITPENLKEIYGVDVQIFNVQENGQMARKICAPIIN
jgi:iron complex transport system ATP-binding protein